MRVCVVSDNRFDRTPDGTVWAQISFPRSFWKRYTEVFDHVRVVARVRDVERQPSGWVPSSGEGVEFYQVPYYQGAKQYLLMRPQVARSLRSSFRPEDAVLLRVPAQLGNALLPAVRKTGHPYGAEVVGDPYDVYAPGGVAHPLRRALRWWSPRQLRSIMHDACVGAYVNSVSLPQRYPVREGVFWTNYSSIDLPGSMIVNAPRDAIQNDRPIELIHVCTLDVPYKATDIVIDAVAACVKRGLDVRLTVCGEGRLRGELEARARNLGLADRTDFLGHVPSEDDILVKLDEADVFVLPSRTEGLPRAMIEAMARGLPCIGSSIGGFPELLPAADLVPPGDVEALARKIEQFATSPARRSEASHRNLQKAREYQNTILQKRRNELYRHLKTETEDWLERQSRA